MPYLIITPYPVGNPSYTLSNSHSTSPFIVLSSTDPLHKTMLKHFQSWSYPISYLDLHAPSPSISPPHRHGFLMMEYFPPKGFISKQLDYPRIEQARFTRHYERLLDGPQCGSRDKAQRWYEEHKKLAAQAGYTEEVFRFWQKRHGRKIERRDLQRQREEGRGIVGVGNRVKYAWWRVQFWARGKDMGGGVSSRGDIARFAESPEARTEGDVRRSRSAPNLVGRGMDSL